VAADIDRSVHMVKRGDEQDEYAGRKTFYARRSAGLPNIGASAVSEALAAVTAMRVDFVGNSN